VVALCASAASDKAKTFERYTVRGMATGRSPWKIARNAKLEPNGKNETVGLFLLLT
jgi:hypothetical protein